MRTLTAGEARALVSWASLVQRCCNPDDPHFPGYGGRGIGVFEAWADPWAFIRDMGERPIGTSIGRIDNDGNYEPSNCRWETPTQQNRNTRRTVRIGDLTQSQVAIEVGLSQATVSRRRLSGKDLAKPAHFKRTKLNRDQVAAMKHRFFSPGSNVAIGREFGVTHSCVGMIRRGDLWADVQALVVDGIEDCYFAAMGDQARREALARTGLRK